MAVSESEISLLIPAYGRLEMTINAINCSLETNAGEILVSDDASGLSLKKIFNNNKDERLRIIEQEKNVGLWQNHYALFKASKGKWIKFLQTDDYFTQDYLQQVTKEMYEETTLVFTYPIYHHIENDKFDKVITEEKIIRYTSNEYLKRLHSKGNEPGRPSYCIYKRTALPIDAIYWENDTSVDLVLNVLAASKGEVIGFPAGNIFTGLHKNQDGVSQSTELILTRSYHAIKLLSENKDKRIQSFAATYGIAENLWFLTLLLSWCLKLKKTKFMLLASILFKCFSCINYKYVVLNTINIFKYIQHKYSFYNKNKKNYLKPII